MECEVYLDDGAMVNASVASDIPTSKYQAVEFRDEDERLLGARCTKGCERN